MANPTTALVAVLVAQRVLDPTSTALTDFDTTTTPTAAQVANLIAMVADEVTTEVGALPTTPVDLAQLLEGLKADTVAKGAAVWVLRSFYYDDDRNHLADLEADYKASLARLKTAVHDVTTTGTLGQGADQPLPVFGFPTSPPSPITTWVTNF